MPQNPQLEESVCVSTQLLPQGIPAAQVAPHTEPEQNSPCPHALLHMPQWAPLVVTSTHTPPQSRCVAKQVGSCC